MRSGGAIVSAAIDRQGSPARCVVTIVGLAGQIGPGKRAVLVPLRIPTRRAGGGGAAPQGVTPLPTVAQDAADAIA